MCEPSGEMAMLRSCTAAGSGMAAGATMMKREGNAGRTNAGRVATNVTSAAPAAAAMVDAAAIHRVRRDVPRSRAITVQPTIFKSGGASAWQIATASASAA